MEKIPKIVKVDYTEDYFLLLTFNNGVKKKYDIKPLMEMDEYPFYLLKDKIIFSMVKVDAGGYGICWNDDIDLSSYELWKNGYI